MRAKEWMHRDVMTVQPDDSARAAMHLIRQNRKRHPASLPSASGEGPPRHRGGHCGPRRGDPHAMIRRIPPRVLVLTLTLAIAGCAFTSGSSRESVGEMIHSISVSNTIQFRYQGDPVLAPLGLKIETYRREVFISGLVQNDAQRARAVAIALDTPGVLAAYFVDTTLPGRPVSRAHYRAVSAEVWAATLAALRAAGYQIEKRQEERSLVTAWRRLSPSWRTLWMGTQERLRLALYASGGTVTVIAVADRQDEGNPSWEIEREEAILRTIGAALDRATAIRS